MIYFCADWHFDHDKDFIYKPRGFNSITEMNTEIIKRHNLIVTNEDDVYVCGDCSGPSPESVRLIAEMRGKIHIIAGNHDSDTRLAAYRELPNVVSTSFGERIKYEKWTFLLSHHPQDLSNFGANIGYGKKYINICGHRHTKDKFLDADMSAYHVEMEAHNCYPVSIDKVVEDIRNYRIAKASGKEFKYE